MLPVRKTAAASLLLLLLLPPSLAVGQVEYVVEREYYELWIQEDCTVKLYLYLEIKVLSGSISKYIRVGLPAESFKLAEVRCSKGVRDISEERTSSFTGVVISPREPTRAGESVEVELEATLEEFVYEDLTNPGYAGIQLIPVWWSAPVRDLRVKVHLPPGVSLSEVKCTPSYSSAGTEEGRAYVYWEGELKPEEKLKLGVAFPARVLKAKPAKPVKPGEAQPWYLSWLPGLILLSIIAVSIALLAIAAVRYWRREPYVPPELSMEVVGVRRDLDPVEAAVLLRIHPGRIAALILLSMVRKGAIKVKSTKPLKVEKTGVTRGLRYYERQMLTCIRSSEIDEDCLIHVLRTIRRNVDGKVSFFLRRQTEEYYRRKIEELWKQVEEEEIPEVKFRKYEENVLWLLIDEDYERKTRRVLKSRRQVEVPVIYVDYWPIIIPRPTPMRPRAEGRPPEAKPPAKAPTEAKPPKPVASIEEFADKLCRSIEEVSSKAIRKVEKAAKALTPEVRVTRRSSSVHRSCVCACVSCACACACVSCACACAGGGVG